MCLDEWGLWKQPLGAHTRSPTPKPTPTTAGEDGVKLEMVPAASNSEEELMNALGLEAYVPPEQRNFGNILVDRAKRKAW